MTVQHSIKPALEIAMTQEFFINDNGLNDSGVVISVFDDADQVDVFYSRNDKPIDQVIFMRNDMTDEQCIELVIKCVHALISGIEGDQLKAVVNAMKADGLNPSAYDILVHDIIEKLKTVYRPECSLFLNATGQRRLDVKSGRNRVMMNISDVSGAGICESFVIDGFESVESFASFLYSVICTVMNESVELERAQAVIDEMVVRHEK